MKIRIFLIALFPLFVTLLLYACKRNEDRQTPKKLRVVASIFPVYDFARNVGKDRADVSLLLPPGVETHSFEPKPGDVTRINESDIFIYTGSHMEPWAGDIASGIKGGALLIIEAGEGVVLEKWRIEASEEKGRDKYPVREADKLTHEHDMIDPHIWLDFSNAEKMVNNILEGFVKKDPEDSDFYIKNAETYRSKLRDLDGTYEKALSNCKKTVFIHGGHFAFSYLARRYGLKYLSAYRGFSPNAEPTPKDLVDLIERMKKDNIKYIFYEELIEPRIAEMISRETGAKLLRLHGAHNVSKDELDRDVTFISLMTENLENLKIGLECQ
ncbi:MAG: zinc ABC transporter substrate-binding protein [Nitrospirota bacterium]